MVGPGNIVRFVAAILACWLVLGAGTARARDFELEAGSRISADTFASADETYISFNRTFKEIPVVVVLMNQRGGNSAMLRITNVSRSGFYAVITEPRRFDGKHIFVLFDYIAMTPGTHRLPGGSVIAAGRTSTSAFQHGVGVNGVESWTTASFGETISGGASVIAGLQTAFNETANIPNVPAAPFMTTAIRNVTPTSVELAIELSQARLGSITVPETIGWIAFPDGGTGSFTDFDGASINWSALTTPANIRGWDDGCFTNNHGLNSGGTIAVAKKNTHIEDDGGWLRSCGKNATTLSLRIDEDEDVDRERNHVPERAGLIAFSNEFHAILSEQIISGTVFQDTGLGGATAHDGVQGGGEAGLADLTVQLLSDATGAVLASSITGGDGAFMMDIPNGAIGQPVRLAVTPMADFLGVSETPGALPGLVNASAFDQVFIFTPASYDIYSAVSFGQIGRPVLAQDRTVTISPGGAARLAHVYTATSAASLSFATAETSSAPAGVFIATIFEDVDCSGTLNGGEGVLTAPVAVSAGQQVCVIVSTPVPAALAAGSTLIYELQVQTSLTGITLTLDDTNTDQVLVDTISFLSLSKQVCNASIGACDPANGTGFSSTNAGNPGDTLQYRIVFTVSGDSPVENIAVQDATPEFSVLVPGSAAIPRAPTGLSCMVTVPAGGGVPGYAGPVEWSCSGGMMVPGDTGIVAFDVQIAL